MRGPASARASFHRRPLREPQARAHIEKESSTNRNASKRAVRTTPAPGRRRGSSSGRAVPPPRERGHLGGVSREYIIYKSPTRGSPSSRASLAPCAPVRGSLFSLSLAASASLSRAASPSPRRPSRPPVLRYKVRGSPGWRVDLSPAAGAPIAQQPGIPVASSGDARVRVGRLGGRGQRHREVRVQDQVAYAADDALQVAAARGPGYGRRTTCK